MDIQIVAVSKIIEGAIEGDLLKVKSYAEHIVKYLEDKGEQRAARIIRSKIDGSHKYENNVVLD